MTDATREDGASAEDARCEGARERARGRGGDAREATRRGKMKRAREDARSSAEDADAGEGDDGDAVMRAIAAARADSLSRRSSAWLDAGGDVENAPGGKRTEINFPGSKEEYEQLLLSGGTTGMSKETLERKLRKKGGDGEDGAEDEEGEWKVSAVIVPEGGAGDARRGDEATSDGATWVQSYDAESDGFYYFHSKTHETTWDRPEGVEIIPDETAAAKLAEDAEAQKKRDAKRRERAFAEARTDAEVTSDALDALKAHTSVDVTRIKLPGLKSWYYEDDSGNWQGPFTAAELMAWRSMLPMELRLFEHGDEAKETTLADVLGDAPLLAQCAALGIVLPPRSTAAHAQHALRAARSESLAPEVDHDGPAAPQSDWERAVMEGLPPEQAIMRGADPAEVARKVLEKRAADLEASYNSTGVYNKVLNRITDASTIAKPTSVYGSIGLDNYVDTTTLDAALHQMKNRKHVKLTKKQIAALKERKRKLKDKFNNEWLRRDD